MTNFAPAREASPLIPPYMPTDRGSLYFRPCHTGPSLGRRLPPQSGLEWAGNSMGVSPLRRSTCNPSPGLWRIGLEIAAQPIEMSAVLAALHCRLGPPRSPGTAQVQRAIPRGRGGPVFISR